MGEIHELFLITKLHRKPGEKGIIPLEKTQKKKSSGYGAPKLRISVRCRVGLSLTGAWGPPQFQESRSRSEKSTLLFQPQTLPSS